MTQAELKSELARLGAELKCLQQRKAKLKQRIIDHPEDRWGEKHYALVIGDEVVLQEIIDDKGNSTK